ncbi:hypothetical protein GCM10020331_086910 [Ectobacillus funiculus]
MLRGLAINGQESTSSSRRFKAILNYAICKPKNECGDGKNTWEYAQYVHSLFRHYFVNGVNSYVYWNMVLEPKGPSTWGWEQKFNDYS